MTIWTPAPAPRRTPPAPGLQTPGLQAAPRVSLLAALIRLLTPRIDAQALHQRQQLRQSLEAERHSALLGQVMHRGGRP